MVTVVEGGNLVEGGIDTGSLHRPTKNKRKKSKGYVWHDEADELGRERELEDEGGRKEPDGVSTEGGVDAGSQSGKLGMRTRRSRAGEDEASKDETMKTPVLRRKRKQQTDLNGTLNGDAIGTSAGRRRKLNRFAQKAEYTNGEAMTMSVSQQPKHHRKRHAESKPVTVEQAEEQDGASDSTGSSLRRESPNELAPGSLDEGFRREKVALTRMDKQKKVGNAAPAIIDQDSPFVKNGKDSALQKTPQCNAQDPLAEHAIMLQDMLEKDSEALIKLKTHILSGLTGERRPPLVNLEPEHQKVHQLIEQTILAGEGNSMLIIGSRGTGKTTLVETVISELAFDHKDEFHVVRLNGFIHTDDKLALREIWRQLGREMEVENDDLNGRSNYADTLTSLLALLAHPVDEEDEGEAATARSVIFILDEFDLFASHPRQTLLYNLFDVAQSRNAPIAVLGLTTKINVVESLEKRVKSRFGQRYVHLSLPKSFAAFQDLCLAAVSYNPSTHDLLQSSKTDLHHLSKTWNAYITTLFSTPSIQHFLLTLYTISKSLPTFLTASLLPIATLTPATLPTPTSFTPPSTLLPPESKLTLLPSLSTLSLSLLIAAARLSIILSTEITTFDMVYEEYVTLASKSKMQSSAAGKMAQGGTRDWSVGGAKGAWEGLVEAELVVTDGGGRGGGREGVWRVDVGLEEVGGWVEQGVGCGGMGVLAKWCREI
ncbi:hypothetical protein N7G274_006896 [Stereocaulon virgatum]|uniref:Origin recognition complex subunit 4 n=1 Tax=Stereocaulon virgatum TaxID=373712 RepID=A0ABR4A442_9LECA